MSNSWRDVFTNYVNNRNIPDNELDIIKLHENLHEVFQTLNKKSRFLINFSDGKFAQKATGFIHLNDGYEIVYKDHKIIKENTNSMIQSVPIIGRCSGCGITNEYQTKTYICFSCKG